MVIQDILPFIPLNRDLDRVPELPDASMNPDIDEGDVPWRLLCLRLRGQPGEEIAIGLARMYLEMVKSILYLC